MPNKNVTIDLLKPYSCFDCQCKILSDVNLTILEAVDWSRFQFLEKYNSRGRKPEHSRVALLRALLYKELGSIKSVNELVRILEADYYKMNILGFKRVPDKSTFSRFKNEFDLDRVMTILLSMITSLDPDFMSVVGVDSTDIHAFRKDPDARWGFDPIEKVNYYGYKVHMLYDLFTLTPITFLVTPANVHDTIKLRPLIKKHGSQTLKIRVLFADRGYDSIENHELMLKAGTTLICKRNKRNSKKPLTKYRLLDQVEYFESFINQLYKKRMDCEYTNNLLKERLDLRRVNTMGILPVTKKLGLTILARQIQVHYQLKQEANPRTTIIK